MVGGKPGTITQTFLDGPKERMILSPEEMCDAGSLVPGDLLLGFPPFHWVKELGSRAIFSVAHHISRWHYWD